jgi:hypothetical protein
MMFEAYLRMERHSRENNVKCAGAVGENFSLPCIVDFGPYSSVPIRTFHMSAITPHPPRVSRSATANEIHIPLSEFIAEGIKIQHRFVPEPVFAKTGVGFMRSTGVVEIAAAKQPAVRRGRGPISRR